MIIYLRLLWSYLKIGLFGFGGGYAMLALIENEIVTPGWVTEKMFTDIVAISQMTPGPIGINSATYIGYVAPGLSSEFLAQSPLWGVLGSLVCTLTVVLPSFVLVLTTSHLIARHRDSAVVQGIFAGLRPVVVGLIASAALLLMNGQNFGTATPEILKSAAVCACAFVGVYFLKIHPIAVILLAGIAGWLFF